MLGGQGVGPCGPDAVPGLPGARAGAPWRAGPRATSARALPPRARAPTPPRPAPPPAPRRSCPPDQRELTEPLRGVVAEMALTGVIRCVARSRGLRGARAPAPARRGTS
jgi:hypothetical protein